MLETSELTTPTALANGLKTRDFTIRAGETGHNVTVVQLTDLHIGYCNEEDLNNPTLASTAQNRGESATPPTWPNRNSVLRNLGYALDYADGLDANQIVITGDALDYLSMGGLNLLKEKIWSRYPGKVLIATGNHEMVQKMCGKVDETVSETDRFKMLKDNWEHDPIYTSRVLRDKVMVIQMDNGLNDRDEVAQPHSGNLFHAEQVELLKKDLELAKKNRYVVLLFFHTPIGTGNPADKVVNATYIPGADSGVHTTQNLYENVAAGTNHDSEASAAIWNLICENSDNIAAVFAGHVHGDFYSEILGKNRNIPQILLTGMAYEKGHALKITVEY